MIRTTSDSLPECYSYIISFWEYASENEDSDATNRNLADTAEIYVDMSAVFESHCESVTASKASSATGTSTGVVEGPAARRDDCSTTLCTTTTMRSTWTRIVSLGAPSRLRQEPA